MNKVLLTGRLTRDPELRSLASGKTVTTFSVATNEYVGGGKEKAEFHTIVTWDKLAQICGQYLGKGQQVAIEGRLQTRSWDDDARQAPLEDRDRGLPRRDAVGPQEEGLRGAGRRPTRSRPRPGRSARSPVPTIRSPRSPSRPRPSRPGAGHRRTAPAGGSTLLLPVRRGGRFPPRGVRPDRAQWRRSDRQAPASPVRSLSSISHAWSSVWKAEWRMRNGSVHERIRLTSPAL